MSFDEKLTPSLLWLQAGREYPEDAVAARDRYMELMQAHGYIITTDQPSEEGTVSFPHGFLPKGSDA